MLHEYTIPEEVLTAHLSDEAVLLHMGSKRYFRLNSTAASIWKGLEKGLGRAQLLDELCERFEVERIEAEDALERHLTELRDRELIRVARGEAEASD